MTTFIGREVELIALRRLLVDGGGPVRLLTLTGPGGCGKSRLALEFADRVRHESADAFPDGIFAVWLAEVDKPDQVARTIAEALGLAELYGPPLVQALKSFFAARRLLLILDNFEHLLAAAPLVGELLGAAPGLHILVTSRSILRVYGEQEYVVHPMQVPKSSGPHAVEQLSKVASVALFTARSRAANPQFVLHHSNAPAVAELCIRLDGLPLAIELAAARTRVLSPDAILNRLDGRLEFLADRNRQQERRHQTLRATLDWSYQLLHSGEQRIFALLAVFPATFTLEAAEALGRECTGHEVLDEIEALVDNSLLVRSDAGGAVRLRFLSLVREYAREHLRAGGESETAAYHHAQLYRRLVAQMLPRLYSQEQALALAALEAEHLNLRTALAYAVSTDQAALGLSMAVDLQRYWLWSSHRQEALEWLEKLLALPTAQSEPALYLHGRVSAAHLAYYISDVYLPKVRTSCEECIPVARALDDRTPLAEALRILGDVLATPEPTRASACYTESLQIYRDLEDARGEAAVHSSLALLAASQGNQVAAQQAQERALAYYRQQGDRWSTCFAILLLAHVQLHQVHDYDAAYTSYLHAAEVAKDSGDQMSFGYSLANLAELSLLQGDLGQAERQAHEALAIMRTMGELYQVPRLLRLLGACAEQHGQVDAAATQYRESLDLNRQIDDRRGIAASAAALARLVAARHQYTTALQILTGLAAVLQEMQATLLPADHMLFERAWQACLAQLSPSDVEAALAYGGTLDLTQLAARAEQAVMTAWANPDLDQGAQPANPI